MKESQNGPQESLPGLDESLPSVGDWTMKPTIQAAKDTAKRIRARQVIVCAFDYNGRMAVISYGVTKAECQDVRPLCDAIADKLDDGTLPYPRINW
jgi:hypothetical protein